MLFYTKKYFFIRKNVSLTPAVRKFTTLKMDTGEEI